MSTQNEQDQASYLDLSDEELLKMPSPSWEEYADEEESTSNQVEENEETPSTENDEVEKPTDESEDSTEESSDSDTSTTIEEPESETEDETATEDSDEREEEETVEKEKPETKEDTSLDYKQEYERLLAPFKANGREMSVQNVDEAVALMQMGANYNKKMAALKPNLKLLKMLQNNNLLSEEKINYLIDLEKKSPEAINKLIKESGIDPMDIDAEKAGDYKPNSYKVDDREIELDTVLEEIQDTPSYNRTLTVIGNQWDKASKEVIANQPQLIKVINDHVERGIYDLINVEMERERALGRLNGLSDLEAYRQVGDAIQARGGFDHLSPQQGRQTPSTPKTVVPNPKKETDSKLREKKRAASMTKPATSNQNTQDFNPLAISDEEFSKLVQPQFL